MNSYASPNSIFKNSHGTFRYAQDIGLENNRTYALAIADFNSDGRADIVSGNSNAQNRLYLQGNYQMQPATAISREVDGTAGNIGAITLKSQSLLFANTSIDYYLSNNAGENFFLVYPQKRFVFPTRGSALRWRADLHSLTPSKSPKLDSVTLERSDGINPGVIMYLLN
jgi:hypothetical protein